MTDMRELRVRSASLDVLGVEVTARPSDKGVEECQCPPGHTGASCQLCAPGHYRDHVSYTCLTCPCHGHEDTCEQDAIMQDVVCTCNRGWVGQFCDTRQGKTFVLTMFSYFHLN